MIRTRQNEGDVASPTTTLVLVILAATTAGGCARDVVTPTAVPLPTTSQVERLISGTVSAIDGNPLTGVQVSTVSGETRTITDSNGSFSLAINSRITLLRFAREGYETRDGGMARGDGPVTLNVRMQRVLVLSDATPLADVLSPADLPYYVGEVYESDYCSPCKIIRLRAQTRAVSIVLRWSGDQSLQLWALDSRAVQSGPSQQTIVVTPTSAETLLHVGLPWNDGMRQVLERPEAFELLATPR
jgi:hypothetical protein